MAKRGVILIKIIAVKVLAQEGDKEAAESKQFGKPEWRRMRMEMRPEEI